MPHGFGRKVELSHKNSILVGNRLQGGKTPHGLLQKG
jgi:hypothetical protein